MAGFYYPPPELESVLSDMLIECLGSGESVERVVPGIYETLDRVYRLNKIPVIKIEGGGAGINGTGVFGINQSENSKYRLYNITVNLSPTSYITLITGDFTDTLDILTMSVVT